MKMTPTEKRDAVNRVRKYQDAAAAERKAAGAAKRNTIIGTGLGYGTLGYGGYKGGQKVKNYVQDKRRGQ